MVKDAGALEGEEGVFLYLPLFPFLALDMEPWTLLHIHFRLSSLDSGFVQPSKWGICYGLDPDGLPHSTFNHLLVVVALTLFYTLIFTPSNHSFEGKCSLSHLAWYRVLLPTINSYLHHRLSFVFKEVLRLSIKMSTSFPSSHSGLSRPATLHGSKSFSRMEHPSPLTRPRASTLQNGRLPESVSLGQTPSFRDERSTPQKGDIFEKDPTTALHGVDGAAAAIQELKQLPAGFDDLPIELVSLTDRFIESLTAKVYPEPPTIEKLSDMFQDFYNDAESHIATHISALSTRQYREASPNPSITSKGSGSRLRSISSKDTMDSPLSPPEQQMLTPQEIYDRRKNRRLLEQKRFALEEAVEKRTCERVYRRLWRHRSTLDEVRDEKLRSRTAALALVGIGLKDLGIEFDSSLVVGETIQGSLESRIEEWIAPARHDLLRMNDARYPLGKLQHLASAHKCIVELLSRVHQSSSSADEILPTLIYALITSPPEGINVISNLNFIQRFRASNKIDGEAAYCLTNLEAAITFLETVDLASLRSDEPLEGPPKSSSRPSTPHGEGRSDWVAGPSLSPAKGIPSTSPANSSPPPPLFTDPLQSPDVEVDAPSPPPSHRRRRSNLFQPTTSALGAASDAMRTTADQGLKNIGSTLDHSFKFLFGRLKEQNVEANGAVILPKTLDDARKLVNPKPAEDDQDDMSGASSIVEKPDDSTGSGSTFDEKLLGVFAGRKQQQQQQPRDRSVDSLQSAGSGGKKVAFASDNGARSESTGQLSSSPSAHEQSTSTATSAVESMRNLGNSLNPLNRFAGMSVMRGFGRNSSGTTPTLATTVANIEKPHTEMAEIIDSKVSAVPPLPFAEGIAPPIKRFIDISDAGELRLGEVTELLKDYQRLAMLLKADGRMKE